MKELGYVPEERELTELIGKKRYQAFREISGAIESLYEMERIWNPGGKAWDYEYKYRRGGKTLCAFYFRKDCLGLMVIFGKDEREKFEARRSLFSQAVCSVYDEAKTYHDGKWVMFTPEDGAFSREFLELLAMKRRPNRKA